MVVLLQSTICTMLSVTVLHCWNESQTNHNASVDVIHPSSVSIVLDCFCLFSSHFSGVYCLFSFRCWRTEHLTYRWFWATCCVCPCQRSSLLSTKVAWNVTEITPAYRYRCMRTKHDTCYIIPLVVSLYILWSARTSTTFSSKVADAISSSTILQSPDNSAASVCR